MKIKDLKGACTEEMVQEFVKKGYWKPGLSYWNFWDINAKKYPDREAIVDSKRRLTWAQVREEAVHLALGFLELGLNKDDVVVAELPNCSEAQILRNGLERVGIVFSHVARFRHKEMKHLLGLPGAVAVVIPGLDRFEDPFDYFGMIQEIRADLPKLKHVVTVGKAPEGAVSLSEIISRGAKMRVSENFFAQRTFDLDEAVFLWYTSGTTGLPKITLSGTNMLTISARELAERWQITHEDVFLAIGDISSGIGISAPSVSALTGCKQVMLEKWDPSEGPEKVLSLIEKEGVTHAIGVPPHAIRIAEHPDIDQYDLSSLRLFAWGGAPMTHAFVEGLEKKLGCRLISFYGSQDNYWVSTSRFTDSMQVRNFTIGKPGSYAQIRIVDENGRDLPKGSLGELLVRSPGGGMGYLKEPEKTAATWDADGWYHTGDLVRLDPDGNLLLQGRKVEMINRGGQNIYSQEVENILRSHPKVAEVVIVPMPDRILGQKVCAYVETKEGESFSFAEMIACLDLEKMAKYKHPERLEIMEKLPRLQTGKVDKARLTEDIRRKLQP